MGTVPDPQTLAFLTKATKGVKGFFAPEVLAQVAPLFGWSLRSHIVAAPLDGEQFTGVLRRLYPSAMQSPSGLLHEHFWGSPRERKQMRVTAAEGPARLDSIRARVVEVRDKNGPSHPEEGRLYVSGLTAGPELIYGQLTYVLGLDGAWYGMPGWTITTPKGSVTFTNKISYSGKVIPFTESAPEKVWSLLYKSGLKDAAKGVLDSFGHETVERALRPSTFRKLDGTGTCPCCFGNVKLREGGRIMRHGWSVASAHGRRRQRGAYGLTWHTGPCMGFGFPPFEVSPEGTKEFLRTQVLPAIAQLKKDLVLLRERPDRITIGFSSSGEKETVSRDTTEKVWVSPGGYISKYENVLRTAIRETEREIEHVQQNKEILEEKIKTWKPQPLPGTNR
jgi:hypothetical protein